MSCNEVDLSCGTGGNNGGNSGSSGMPSGFGGITADGLVGGIRVKWGYPVENSGAVAYVQVHRAPSPHLNNATLVAVVNANYYEDYFDSDEPQNFSYWIRYVATNNKAGEFIGPATARSFDKRQDYLDNLYGQIDEDVLATQLKEKLDGIRLNSLDINQEIIDRAKETDALGARLTEVKGFTDDSLAILQEEIKTQAEENSAVGQYVNILMTEVDENKAAVETEKEARIDEDKALAKSLEKIDIELNGNEVLGEAGLRGMVNELTGEVYGMWTAKVETNGLIGGFGLANDGTTVEAGFDVDRFWIGRSSNDSESGGRPKDGYYPFLISDNDIAFNGKVSFSNVTGEDRPVPYATRNEYQGNYRYNRRYTKGDVVFFRGNGWSARKDHLARYSNRPPTEASAEFNEFWDLAAQQGDTPTVTDNGDGTYTIEGANGEITIKDGNDGDVPTVTNLGGGEYRVTDPKGNSVTISDGANGYTPVKNRDYFDGATGNYHSIIYREYEGDLTAHTPSGGSFDGTTETFPTKWSDNPPSNPTHTVWVSRAVYEATVNNDGSESWSRKRDWSVPSKFYEKGDRGPQGVKGQRGEDGAVYYTWIRYADDEHGNGISNNPTGKEFMGLAYNKNTATESSDKNDYTWSRFRGFDGEKGDEGVRGPQGPDGKPTYTWIVYGTSSSGANLHQKPHQNTTHIGIANNKLNAKESTDPGDYTWSKFKGDSGPRGYSGENGQDGEDGDSTLIIYRSSTSKPNKPGNTSGVPSGWTRDSGSLNGVIWETTGTRLDKQSNYIWSSPRIDSDLWRKSNSVEIDGGSISADEAWIVQGQIKEAQVDTLQIKGQAVTLPSSSYTASRMEIGSTWTDIASIYVPTSGAPVQVMGGLIWEATPTKKHTGIVRVRVLGDSTVIWEGVVGQSFYTVDSNGSKWYWYFYKAKGSATPVGISYPSQSGKRFSVQARNSGDGGSVHVSNRYIGTLELKR